MLGASTSAILGDVAWGATTGALDSVISGGDPIRGALMGALGGSLGDVAAMMGATHGLSGAISSLGVWGCCEVF